MQVAMKTSSSRYFDIIPPFIFVTLCIQQLALRENTPKQLFLPSNTISNYQIKHQRNEILHKAIYFAMQGTNLSQILYQ